MVTNSIAWERLRYKTRKVYCNIKRQPGQEHYLLCKLCQEYLLQSSTQSSTYWPSMIWKFLDHKTINPNIIALEVKEKWRLIPTDWRNWWLTDIKCLDDTLSLTFPEPCFYLATSDLEELHEAIESLEWKLLGNAMDKYLYCPSVRCPFGCSEFLHQCNKLPLEDFLVYLSNGCFKGYTHAHNMKKDSWTNGIKPNFPSSVILLEDDIHLICRPTIVIDDHLGCCILACANHNKLSTEKYIHPPESPTGTLYTEMSNQYSQAVIQSRTLRKTKLNSYSDTYQTSMLQGGYDGLDSCFLTSAGKYVPTNKLADLRDCLSIAGRDDLRNHVAQLAINPEAKNYVPPPNVHDKLQRSERLYPNILLQVQQNLRSSTFIDLHDAVRLQEQIYNDSAQAITIEKDSDNNDNEEEEVLFKAPWPAHLLHVHPYDGFGGQFDGVDNKTLQCFVGWSMLALVMCIPYLWSSVATSITNNKDWKGWLLSVAWNQIASKSKHSQQKNHFPLHNHVLQESAKDSTEQNREWLRNKLGINNNTKNSNIKLHKDLWSAMKKVLIMEGNWIENHPQLPGTSVVILLRDPTLHPAYQPFMENDHWELRLAILKKVSTKADWEGTIYTRHGGDIGPHWWVQTNQETPHFFKCKGPPMEQLRCHFQLCVYVTKQEESNTKLRNRYLSFIGGQNVVHCNHHKVPLILNPIKTKTNTTNDTQNEANKFCRCCCEHNSFLKEIFQETWTSINNYCDNEASLVCAHVGCEVAMCNKHLTSFTINNDSHIYMLGNKTCLLSTIEETITSTAIDQENILNEDDSVASTNMTITSLDINDKTCTMHTSALPHTSDINGIPDLGPCDGYEYPGQLFPELEQYDSDDNEDIQDMNMPLQLTTHAAADMQDVEFNAPEEIASCPLHILLNQQGHLLVRKKSKLRMNRRHANFFQRIVSTTKGKTLPLAYAEALLFPDIFFFATKEGSILGAIPTALWTDETTLKMLGIASMRKHAKARLSDPATLCSTDSRYHFMTFDCLVNLGMRGNDSRLILHRGFASKQNGDGVTFNTSDNAELYTDTEENHSNVHKLASLIAESPPHFFFTQSCNQSTCRGLAKLRQWVTNPEAISKIQIKYGVTYEEAFQILRKSAAPYVQRVWNVIADLWMRYIVYSKEEPLHKIDWAWWRKEFQDEAGNLSHIHALLKTKHDITTDSGRNIVLEKIRGSLQDLVHYQDLIEMKNEGLIDSIECYGDILQQAFTFLTHKCSNRCQIPKVQENGDIIFVCKAPINKLLTPQPQVHTIQPVRIQHSSESLSILFRLGLAQKLRHENNETEIVITHPLLKMERHIPKTSSSTNIFSPTNGKLFVMMPSSQNLQYCTGHSLSLYLTSYVTEIDRVSLIFIHPPTKNKDHTFRLQYHSLNNTKIRRVNNYHTKNLQNNKKTKHLACGRAITHMEALTVIFGSPLVYSTREFIHYPTCPREYRAAMTISYKKTTCKPKDLQALHAVTGHTIRQNMKLICSRQFSSNQLIVIQDEVRAPLSTDQVTYFSIRPPELRFIRNQILYFKWFERKAVTPLYDPKTSMEYLTEHLSVTLRDSEWLDGLNYKIVLRRVAIESCLNYAMNSNNIHFGIGREGRTMKNGIVNILQRLLFLYQIFVLKNSSSCFSQSTFQDWIHLSKLFLSNSTNTNLPVLWFTPVSPKRKNAFLIQLLLTMGEFETEYELMLSGNLKKAFIISGLFDPKDPGKSIDNILKRYVLEQLRTFPGNHYLFDRNLSLAECNLREALLGTTPSLDSTPSVLFSHMKHDTDLKIELYVKKE